MKWIILFSILLWMPCASYAFVCKDEMTALSSGVRDREYKPLLDEEVDHLIKIKNEDPKALFKLAVSYIPMLIDMTSKTLLELGLDQSHLDDIVQEMIAPEYSDSSEVFGHLIRVIKRFNIDSRNKRYKDNSAKDSLSGWISTFLRFEVRREALKLIKEYSKRDENEDIFSRIPDGQNSLEASIAATEGEALLQKLIPIIQDFLSHKRKHWKKTNEQPLKIMDAIVARRWFGDATYDEIGQSYKKKKGSIKYAEITMRRDFLNYIRFYRPDMMWLLEEWKSYLND